MDNKDEDNSDLEKTNEEPLSYHSLGVSPEWRYDIPDFANSSMGPSCSNGSMADSFGPTVWDHPSDTSPLGFSELNVHNNVDVSDPLSILKGGLFLSTMSGMLPHSLPQFPTDLGFIDRAARFSSFSGGHFGDMLNPMSIHQSCSPFVRAGAMMQGPHEISSGNGLNTQHNQKPEDISLPRECAVVEGKSPKIERSHDEAKHDVSMVGNDSDEPEFSSGVAQEEGMPLTSKDVDAKKRKRGNQDPEVEQAHANQQQSGEAKTTSSDTPQNGEQNSTPTSNKSNAKNGKQNSQASDSPKEEYIHVRARRGQATNSHSLAERVRREKISERMKFLQDLVPGCNKVTGKAVMLDEIINYVQSLQRQVEFLSMKLATVNPRLNFNIDRLLAKDKIFSAQAGPSSGLTFSPDIPIPYHPLLHPIQSPMLRPGTGNSFDACRRVISLQFPDMGSGNKESSLQLPDAWDGELHNIFNANAPIDTQETNCSEPQEQTKAES